MASGFRLRADDTRIIPLRLQRDPDAPPVDLQRAAEEADHCDMLLLRQPRTRSGAGVEWDAYVAAVPRTATAEQLAICARWVFSQVDGKKCWLSVANQGVPLSEDAFVEAFTFVTYRSDYLRVSGPGPNRLQVASTLAGLTAAGFVALLSGKPIDNSKIPNAHEWLLLASGFGLALATILFLIAAVSTYEALRSLAYLDPAVTDALKASTVQGLSDEDVGRLAKARAWYRGGSGLTTMGLTVILISLAVIGAYVNAGLGVLIAASSPAIARKRTGYPLEWFKTGWHGRSKRVD